VRGDFVVLIVEDDVSLRETMAQVLGARTWTGADAARAAGRGGLRVQMDQVGSVAEVRALPPARTYALVLLDFRLPDGTGADVLDYLAEQGPLPLTIAISGETAPGEAFHLAQKGVRSFLQKPFGLEELNRAIDQALRQAPDPVPMVRSAVGQTPLKELEEDVRAAMVKEALVRSGGSVRGAATLLGISRQTLEHILKKDR
jgi:two-component system, response regulator RegA